MICSKVCPWLLVAVGCAMSVTMNGIRAATVDRSLTKIPGRFWVLLGGAVVAATLAAGGYYCLLRLGSGNGTDNSVVVKVLALLAAGVTAGFYRFSYRKAHPTEHFLPNAISISFTVLYYLLFGAVSYFIGQHYGDRVGIAIFVLLPLVMWLLLVASVLFDFWDYVTIEPEEEGGRSCK